MSSEGFTKTLQEWMEVSMRFSMRNFLRYARESGLSMSNFGAIFHIHRIGSCGVTEIGEHLGVTSAAASQMLDRLVDQGLIERSEDPEDRRVKRIQLTEDGRRVYEQGIQARQSWMEDLDASLSQDEKKTIATALETMIARVKKLDDHAVHSEVKDHPGSV
jgi:DNA-binding MarR family transcriptional regulator